MSVETYVDGARTRVDAEREALDAKRAAFERFGRRVRSLSADPSPARSTAVATVSGPAQRGTATGDARRRDVRQAFDETVRLHSLEDVDDGESEPLLETVGSELSEPIALALAPTTDASFTPKLKRSILGETAARRSEIDALDAALDREADHLSDAAAAVDDITGWIAADDETPLRALGFDALAERHETLGDLRTRCGELARRRQAFLDETTNNGAEAGVSHRQLPPYLYRDFPVDHPVLATAASLDETCRACRRAVRGHLVRRA